MTSGIPGSLILGNGDLNGILWVNNGQLQFQIAKNDVADGVLNTTNDPALPTVNLQTGTWTGNVNYPSMPSWSDYDNPCPVIMGQVNFSLGGSTLSSNLNIQNATATVTASGGSSLAAMVLQGENVAEFDTSGTVSLSGCSVSYIPSSDTSSGTTNGVQWTTTTIPGNSDVPAMSYALAMAASGTRHVLAAVDSLENANPLSAAQQLASNALAAVEAQLQAAQTAAWAHFWAKSGVQLDNTSLQTQWYRNLYYSACASRPGAAPVGLCLGTDDINFSSLWKGIETSDYNFEQAFWGAYDTNHPELSEAYTQYLAGYEPVAEWYAQNVFGLSGAAYPHNQWVNECTDPAASTLPRHGLLAYPPYSLGLGLGGWILQNVWNSYLYDPNTDYLSTTVYPLMKQAAIFYAAALNACPKNGGGQAIYGPSYVEELGSYGVDDVTSDIGFTQLDATGRDPGRPDAGRRFQPRKRLAAGAGAVARLPHRLGKFRDGYHRLFGRWSVGGLQRCGPGAARFSRGRGELALPCGPAGDVPEHYRDHQLGHGEFRGHDGRGLRAAGAGANGIQLDRQRLQPISTGQWRPGAQRHSGRQFHRRLRRQRRDFGNAVAERGRHHPRLSRRAGEP